jgi:hypothetical protein
MPPEIDETLRDLTAYADEATRVRRAAGGRVRSIGADAALRERVLPHLDPARVGAVLADARGPSARESDRRRFRAVARAFLDRHSAAADRELAERRARLERPAGGAYEIALATAAAPERRGIYDRWEIEERELAPCRQRRWQARLDAAREAGARSTAAFLAAECPVFPADLVEPFRRAAIEPLTEAVRAASRGRVKRLGLGPLAPSAAEDAPALAAVSEHRADVSRETISAAMSGLARAVGSDVGDLHEAETEGLWPAVRLDEDDRPVLVRGALAGPAALAAALGALGAAGRQRFLRRVRPADWHWCDPAFSSAAEWLFRRLALGSPCLEWLGLGGGPPWLAALRLEIALAPRQAWAYLCLAAESITGAVDPPPPTRVEQLLALVQDRAPTPRERAAALDADPAGASDLRGMVLALLLEERLLTRFGRRWFLDEAAWRQLRECWEAEPDETAESMAAALDLGRIEPTPVLDRFRP